MVLGLLALGEAAAQDRPHMLPTRDVDITYRVVRAGQTLDERVRWRAAEQLERVDPPGSVYMIVNHKTRRIDMVNPAGKSVLQLDAPRRDTLEPDSAADYTKLGETKIAGVSCTEWATTGGAAPEQLCVTPDGVLLRIRESGKTLLEATRVVYRRLDPETFEVPAKFQMTPPPAAAPPPPGMGAIVPE